MYDEDDLLPLSALQHILFCERQCALIHVEQLWAENPYTVEGQHLHAKAHAEDAIEERAGVRIVRGLAIRSLRLGLTGKTDVVEFYPDDQSAIPVDDTPSNQTGNLPLAFAQSGKWLPFPVEYKRGKPKKDHSDEVQLCAQALCLEEMLHTTIPAGALFYGKTRRRKDVAFTHELRTLTASTAARLHTLIAGGRTPPAVREPKCENCSLLTLCMPEATSRSRSAADYFNSLWRTGP